MSAERLLYTKLDDALDLVGALHVDSAGTLTWFGADADSGSISCAERTPRFLCRWTAKLIQSYRGTAWVSTGRTSRVTFTYSTCKNPLKKGLSLPNLCAIDPVPGTYVVLR